MCLNMCVSSFCCIGLGIRNTLLRKVTLEKICVFKSMAFPLKDKCLLESCCVCFSIPCIQLFQLLVLVVFRSSVKSTPTILIISFVCMLFFLSRLQIFPPAEGKIVVLEMLIVAPVATSYFFKNCNISIINSSVSTKKFVSSTYCESLCFFLIRYRITNYFVVRFDI